MVVSDITNPKFNAVHIETPENRNTANEWHALRSTWEYIYNSYIAKYDFFYLSDDDSYLIVENLRFYLASNEVVNAGGGEGWPKPLYLGRRVFNDENTAQFNHGGPGYVLNRAALKLLVEKGFRRGSCRARRYQQYTQDEAVGDCYSKISVFAHETRDVVMAHRFHVFTPQQHAAETYGELTTWFQSHGCHGKVCLSGWDSVSEQSISFHFVQPNLMKQIHALLYNLCIPPDLLELASRVVEIHKASGRTWARPVIPDFLTLGNHPFMGALDVHGNGGYRHDEKALRLNPPAFAWEQMTYDANNEKAICRVNWNPETSNYEANSFQRTELGQEGYKLLTQQVRVMKQQSDASIKPTVFCAVYTISPNHFRIEPIRQTWGYVPFLLL